MYKNLENTRSWVFATAESARLDIDLMSQILAPTCGSIKCTTFGPQLNGLVLSWHLLNVKSPCFERA